MVVTNGSNITNAYVSGGQVSTIYTYGEKVWPPYSRPYYIRWTPSNISTGTFTIDSRTFHFSHYSGDFYFSTGVIGSNAFRNNSTIMTIDTNAFSIGEYAFDDCEILSSFDISNCEYIGYGAFKDQHIRHTWYPLSLPVCSYIGSYAFYSSRSGKVDDLYCPVCEYIGSGAFECCEIDNLDLPKCSYIGDYAFEDNPVGIVHLSSCEYIGSYAFRQDAYDYISGCLRSVYIYTSSVCSLGGSRVFGYFTVNPEVWHVLGEFYVPSSLVSAYKSAEYWSQMSNRIHPIP